MTLFSSFFDTFSTRLESAARRQDPQALAEIRSAMVNLLPSAPRWDIDHVRLRIGSAQDVQQLWFLRAEMNQVMCPVFGEQQSLVLIEQLTPLFEGLIDDGFIRTHQRQRARSRQS